MCKVPLSRFLCQEDPAYRCYHVTFSNNNKDNLTLSKGLHSYTSPPYLRGTE